MNGVESSDKLDILNRKDNTRCGEMQLRPTVAVVVTYNRPDLLENCIKHISVQTFPCDILVVDNASTDDTCARMTALVDRGDILYRRMEKNLGGAGGFHFGMRWAAESGYDYVWVMDDDCQPENDALEKLMDAGKVLGGPDKYGFLSGAVLWTDGQGCLMNRQKIVRNSTVSKELADLGIFPVEQATFVSTLIPTAHIWQYGLPLAEYFIWNDDIEYTRRLAVRNKLPCYLVGQSRAVHLMSENCGSNVALDKPERIARYRYAYRNECCTYHREGLYGRAYYAARCGRDFLRILFLAKDHRLERFGALFSGMFQGLFFRPEVEYPRRK